MNFEITRNSESHTIMVAQGSGFVPADLNVAFSHPMDAEETQLFSDIYSPTWEHLKTSERFAVMARLAKRVEDAPAPAEELHPSLQPESDGEPA